jgi:hypothetical protein
MHDQNLVRDLLRDAGFRDAQNYEVAKNAESPSAKDAAKGLLEGNPIIVEINQRATSDLQTVETAVAKAIAAKCGDNPVRGKLRAFVWTVRK